MYKKELYPKKLFELIIAYAQKKAEILGIEILESIQKYTPIFYLIGNYSWDFNSNSPHWKELILRFNKGENLVEIAYEKHVNNYQDPANKKKWFGCFGYKYSIDEQGEGVVKIHFLNDGSSVEGPLALSQYKYRIKELKEMFEEIQKNHPDTKYVQGGSWLYNLDSYKRLFPKEYVKNMKSRSPKTSILVIWGQFLNSEWQIKEDMSKRFLDRLHMVKTLEDLDRVFEMKELYPKGEIEDFINFYSKFS